jgi:hypothetical protein
MVEILPMGDFSGKVLCTASSGEVKWLNALAIECAPAVDLLRRWQLGVLSKPFDCAGVDCTRSAILRKPITRWWVRAPINSEC